MVTVWVQSSSVGVHPCCPPRHVLEARATPGRRAAAAHSGPHGAPLALRALPRERGESTMRDSGTKFRPKSIDQTILKMLKRDKEMCCRLRPGRCGLRATAVAPPRSSDALPASPSSPTPRAAPEAPILKVQCTAGGTEVLLWNKLRCGAVLHPYFSE